MNTQSVLSGLQTYGRWRTYLGAGIGVLVLLALIVAAIFVARNAIKDPHDKSVIGTLTNVVCTSQPKTITTGSGKDQKTTSMTVYNCKAHVTYTVNGKTYGKDLTFGESSTPYSENQSVTIHYNPADPQDSTPSPPIHEYWAFGAIAVGISLIVAVIAGAVFVTRSKTLSGLAGAAGAVDLARDIF